MLSMQVVIINDLKINYKTMTTIYAYLGVCKMPLTQSMIGNWILVLLRYIYRLKYIIRLPVRLLISINKLLLCK